MIRHGCGRVSRLRGIGGDQGVWRDVAGGSARGKTRCTARRAQGIAVDALPIPELGRVLKTPFPFAGQFVGTTTTNSYITEKGARFQVTGGCTLRHLVTDVSCTCLIADRHVHSAGVAQWKSRWLPPRRRGFDSRCPLHFFLSESCLRLAAQDSRLSSGTTRVQIPQAGPIPPSSNGRTLHFECGDRGSNP
jgi:hypothetical protein